MVLVHTAARPVVVVVDDYGCGGVTIQIIYHPNLKIEEC
jgi:hypothetical protein